MLYCFLVEFPDYLVSTYVGNAFMHINLFSIHNNPTKRIYSVLGKDTDLGKIEASSPGWCGSVGASFHTPKVQFHQGT